MTITGFGMMVQMASTNTVIQTIVDEEKRGRVMSFYTMSFLGTAPFGSLLAGWLSSAHRRTAHGRVSGVLCIATAAWFARELPAIRELVRPIYRRMGILPEVAQGLQTVETTERIERNEADESVPYFRSSLFAVRSFLRSSAISFFMSSGNGASNRIGFCVGGVSEAEAPGVERLPLEGESAAARQVHRCSGLSPTSVWPRRRA